MTQVPFARPGIIRTAGPIDPLESDKQAYTTFVELGGRSVSLDDVRQRLGELQLDLVLGILARISAHFVRDGNAFFNPSNQGQYLAYAIADDFPSVLPGAATMYAPGRIPITGERHTFIHEHGLSALAQLAIAHCRTDVVTKRISLPDFGHVGRLLLILNDHLTFKDHLSETPTLAERRRFAVNSLYHFQFNQVSGDITAQLALARLHQLLIVYLPKYLPDAHDQFLNRTGTSVASYLRVAGLMLTQVPGFCTNLDQEQSPWTNIDSLVTGLLDPDEVRAVLGQFRQSPDEFKSAHAGKDDIFDFENLQHRPLVEARPNESLWPVMSLFLRQLLSFPLQVIATLDQGTRAVGNAYEDYAHSLVERIARGDRHGKWTSQQNYRLSQKRGGTAGEIDSLLWRDGVAVVIEHKAGNFGTHARRPSHAAQRPWPQRHRGSRYCRCSQRKIAAPLPTGSGSSLPFPTVPAIR